MHRKLLPILALPLLVSCGKSDAPAGNAVAVGTRTSQPFEVTSPPGINGKIEYADPPTDTPVEITDAKGEKWMKKADGLRYRDLNEGQGVSPEIGQKVEVKFASYHLDMRPILNSLDDYKAAPFVFFQGKKDDTPPLFYEAVIGMHKNGKRRVIVPPELAYGKEGNPALKIDPGETLIYDIELTAVSGIARDAAAKAAAALTQPDTQPATLPSDLIIEDIKLGAGPIDKPGVRCTFKYTGKLADGTPFDAGEFNFVVGSGAAIEGFDLGTRGMKLHGTRKITVPPRLGYAEKGMPGKIPPNATLYFEVELIKVE